LRLGISTGMPGPHDFAVRIKLFVGANESRCSRYAHRIPRSTFVTIAIRASWSRRDGHDQTIISAK
jgi:hypothetical protein